MSASDRLFLEEFCPTLQQKLQQKLVDKPESSLDEQDFQDFEVQYSVVAEPQQFRMKVTYPFLADVLKNGSQALLERVCDGIPLKLKTDVAAGTMEVTVDTDAVAIAANASSSGSVVYLKRCVDTISAFRMWLLIGPLVSKLQWLQQNVANAAAAAAQAKPGQAVEAREKALGQPPPMLVLQLRRSETTWIVPKPDRILVIMSVHLEDEVDMTLGRAFCQEFAETNRKATDFSLPCNFHEPKEPPPDLRGQPIANMPNVGFLTMTLSDQTVKGASEERLYALARPVMTFRNFFHFHLKHAKSYLHSRLRRRIENWGQKLNVARRPPRRAQEKRRLVSGKEFVPPSRT